MKTFALSRTNALAALALSVAMVTQAAAQAPLSSVQVDYEHDTGEVWNTRDEPSVVISFPVLLSDAEWVRLYFDRIQLGDALLRITSYEDGDAQELRARHCVEWQNSSCYFNGCCVQVEVEAPPRSGPYRLVLSHVDAGVVVLPSQCGPTDDRVLWNDPRVGRILSATNGERCTVWIIEDRNRGLLTAGHCGGYLNGGVIQFNVPNSDGNGTPTMPSPDDQYAVDPLSVQTQLGTTSVGDDWAYFGVFANPNTNLSVGRAQGSCFALAEPPAGSGQSLEISGHGIDATPAEHNRVQQIHSGTLVATVGTTIRYDVDTETGNSGSPVVWTDGKAAIGIHTTGGCNPLGGDNSGTAMTNQGLLAALRGPRGVCREPKLLAADGAEYDWFGSSVSASGDTVVAGAWLDDDNGTSSGSAYVFVRTGTSWTQQAKLLASDGAPYDSFGGAIAVSGDTVLVGAHTEDDNGPNSGSVYVFVRSGTGWTQHAKLLASDGAADDYFGIAISVCGDTAVVGAFGDDNNGNHSGSAYVFVRNVTSWMQQAKLLPTDGMANDEFGRTVAVSGDTVIVGAYRDDDNGSDSGSAYVFVRNGTTWTQQGKILAEDGGVMDNFGYPVAVSFDTAIVGARLDDDNGIDSGSTYVFVRNGMTWTQQAKLLASDGALDDQFGSAAAVNGDMVIVGAWGDDNNGSASGSAYVFVRSRTTWMQQARLLASDGAANDEFGRSLSMSGDTAVVGAYGNDDDGTTSGSAYVFSLPCNTSSIYCTAKINSRGCLPAIRYSGTPSLTVVSAFDLIATSVTNNQMGLLLYSRAGPSNQPFQGGTLCILPPVRRTPSQNSGGHTGGDDCSGAFTFDFNDWLRTGNDAAVQAGTKVYGQFWYRDPGASFGSGLTNAVEFAVLP